MEKVYDIVIFGATGFTGQVVVSTLAKYVETGQKLVWAVAGRDVAKLENIMKEIAISKKLETVKNTPYLSADVGDYESLVEMAKMTRVIVNCVGPYHFYGEQVVRACIDGGAHHVDISGEPLYMERMQYKYHQMAANAGVYIVSACGFDSLPADAGTKFTSDNFKGDLNEVEAYIVLQKGKSYPVHDGTWNSAVHGFSNRKQLSELRRSLYPTKLPPPSHKQVVKGSIFRSPDRSAWCMPFLGSDRSVVYRSQRFLQENNQNHRLIQFTPYICLQSFWSAIFLSILGLLFGLMATFRPTRWLQLKFPRVFSCGIFTHEGPTQQQLDDAQFEMKFVGRGWDLPSGASLSLDHREAPNRCIVTRLCGPEPGYVTCSICVLQAAMVLLEETALMPNKGGVYAPGAIFWKTTLLERLEKNGLKFEVLADDETSELFDKNK